MPQLLFQGFPDGAIRIGTTVSVLKKDGNEGATRQANVGESKLRKAVKSGRVVRASLAVTDSGSRHARATSKSERGHRDE